MFAWELIAKGRVQGVGFRWFVRECAQSYSIKGYVRNLADGSVKIVACGDTIALHSFTEQIRNGNRHAVVRSLDISELTNYSEYEDFVIA
jgi:acylphosphatase